ncbi:hypothetical protein PJ311_03020 [Bacillus sp. CLL-7-23]|uniref:Uncharacterized protein n=1 Tax=Bacillus changyiensis TaxID=3004103 RepID=A0ABT4X2G2_9BACI|nr:hypothetical protein [Bacillus changyiensis]MDA7025582.1 hypothetical protein [Bacillus changyiensis]
MFQLSLFVKCQNKDEALEILQELINKINTHITSYNLVSNEPYWKIDDWFEITCNIETSNVLDIEKAESILEKISNKWSWNKGRFTARSTANNADTVFYNDKVQFFTCWFEDLD